MPPSPSPSHNPTTAVKAQHARNSSGTASPRTDSKASKKQPTAPSPAPNVHYTLLIRLPFARGIFVDPPQVEWDANKDKRLWKLISKAKLGDINWEQRCEEFGVTAEFLTQQAAWLYERHLQHIQAQMSRIRPSNVASPAPGASGHPGLGGIPMKRLGSGGASRAPSSLSIRSRDSPIPKIDGSIPGTPRANAPPLSRTPSTNTITQSRHFLPPSPRQPVQRSFRTSNPPAAARKLDTAPLPYTTETGASSPTSSTTSTSSSESDTAAVKRSQMFRRPPPFSTHKKSTLSNVDDLDDEESEEDSPTFLPFAKATVTTTTAGQRPEDPSATLRDTDSDPRNRIPPSEQKRLVKDKEEEIGTESSQGSPAYKGKGKGKAPLTRMESSASSASSAPAPGETRQQHQKRRLDALSPRHRAELARLSPRRRGTKQDGSDGTPSMGSSFSDLDDTSITQSALEEALASNLRHGGASRLSTISHAFRSRYL
ncbi:hypothetical protein EJ08DRAFT_645374 [Tothia fuscella]|uniref:Autophagy-related protein 29 n=1 Tax=Tothia fuscella TaxID=1048955 RepID=A0A9P4P1G5_9PEZI|nr:hypothetical protein EJ08DRAFT_645374 [Tothia fuscella]